MAINTLANYEAALRERVRIQKTFLSNSIATYWNSSWQGTGLPSAGSSSLGATSGGAVPTDSSGAPGIAFSSGSGYITSIEVTSSYPGRIILYDRLFHAGAYAFNAATTLASQPSYSSRVPGGTDYTGLQIWFEGVTTATGVQNVAVTYTDQSNNTGHTTGTIACTHAGNAMAADRMLHLPLASGDCGVKAIESVTGTVASAGSFNILVVRPLAMIRIHAANTPVLVSLEELGMPQIWTDSCLCLMQATDAASNPVPIVEMDIEIASA